MDSFKFDNEMKKVDKEVIKMVAAKRKELKYHIKEVLEI
jgi:hypothetical protein